MKMPAIFIAISLLALTGHAQVGDLSSEQAELVAATLILEAGGERHANAMVAIYEVIRNLSVARKKTLVEVCFKRKQFSCWNNTSKHQELLAHAKKHKNFSNALDIVKRAKDTNVTCGADHYHAKRVNPYWVPTMTRTAVIGNHIFYRSK